MPSFGKPELTPGVYWATTLGQSGWNAIARVAGKAPFMSLNVLVLDGPRVETYSEWSPENVVLGPKISEPAESPSLPEGWLDSYTERMQRARSATKAMSN